MSQPFEAFWCGNPAGNCQGSESDFVNFVTQAALQARAVNPDLQISDGLSTNPRYFNQAGDPPIADAMYQDSADVADIVNSAWMNVVGESTAPDDTVAMLRHIDDHDPVTVHKSVLFAQAPGMMGIARPSGSADSTLDLSATGNTYRFVSSDAVPGGTTIPAGGVLHVRDLRRRPSGGVCRWWSGIRRAGAPRPRRRAEIRR